MGQDEKDPPPDPSHASDQMKLSAPADAAPPGDDATPRAGTNVPLANPLTDGAANSAHYAALSAAIGYGLDKLAERFPIIERNLALRFLEEAISIGAQIPLMVVSHEAGHYRAAEAVDARPDMAMTGFATGVTHWRTQGCRQEMIIDAAGVNQEQANAAAMFEKFAQNGGVRYQEAFGYLLAQTNLALYAVASMVREARGDALAIDDISNYLDQLNASGHPMTRAQLAAIALATDLLSAPVWAALIGQVRFLVSGARDVAMPTISVGDVTVTLPSFQTLLTADGPVVGGQVMINPEKQLPVEISAHMRIDEKAAAAVGIKLFNLPLGTDRVTLSPFLRGTYDERTGPGVAVGAELEVKVYKDVAVTGTVQYQKNDLLAEPEGTPEGVSGTVGVKFPF